MQVLASVLIFLGLALLAFTSMASAPRIVRMEPSSRAIPSATTVSPASPLPVSAPANEGKTQASGAGAPSEASRSDLSTRSGAVADPTCHARLHTDYMGERAPVWGLGKPGFHLQSAAECCAACQAHNRVCGKPGSSAKAWWPSRPELRCGNNPGCNVWVYCPEKQCFAFDIHVHTQGECWLKQQHANITRPKDPHEGHTSFPAAMRASPREVWPWAVDKKIWPGGIPEKVPWISGVLAPEGAQVTSAPADDRWRKRWCDKHAVRYGQCDP